MGNALTYLLVQIAGLISGGIGGAIGTVTRLIGDGSKQLMKFHEEGIAFARDMGMSLNQAQAYTATLTKNTADLAKQYGVAAEQIKAVQRGISEATNRQLMLNSAQVEGFVALNKLVGDATVSKFAEEMMTGMGAQVSTVEGAISKAYITSAKNGLNAKKVTADIAGNLSMMNKLSFRNGVDGLTKMAVQAQKVGMSLSQVESVAKTFMDFDQSIEHAAQLQMLGGAAGAMGGNPLDMMYEANYDPEALQDRMIKMMSGYATFDAKTGMSKINGMGMDFIRNIAKAMGMDEGEAVKVAKKNAEIQYKTEKLGGMQGLTEDQKSAVINKSYVENGRVYVNDKNDNKVDITGGNIPPELVNFLSEYEGMDELEIMKKQAQELSTINESINGFWESAMAEFGKAFNSFIPGLMKFVKDVGPVFINAIKPVAANLGDRLKTVLTPENIQKLINSTIAIVKGIGSVAAFFTKNWPLLLAAIAANSLLKRSIGLGTGGFGSNMAGAAAKSGGNMLSRMHKGSAHEIFSNTYQGMGRLRNQTWWSRTRTGAKLAWKGTSGLAKGTAAIGALTGLIQGAGAISEYSRKKEEINNSNMSAAEKEKAIEQIRTDRNSEVGGAVGVGVGTILGTFFFGPLGGMIGGAVGEFAGKFIGKYWDPIVNTVTSIFKKIGDGLVWLGGKLWDGIKWLVDNNPIGIMVKGIGKLVGKDWSITGAIGSLFSGGEKHANGGIVGGNGGVDSTPAMLTPGEMVLSKEQQSRLFNAIKNLSIPPIPSVSNITNNSNANSRHTIQTREVTIQNIGGNRSTGNLYNSPSYTRNSNISNISGDRKSTGLYNSSVSTRNVDISNIGGNRTATNLYNSTFSRRNLNTSNIVGGDRSVTNYHNSIANTRNIGGINNIGGDKVLTSLLNPVSNLVSNNNTSSIFNNSNESIKGVAPIATKIEAKPVGQKEYINTRGYHQQNSQPINGSVKVNDFNVNIGGTLRLDGGNSSKNIDIKELLKDPQFVNTLKDTITNAISSSYNGGRHMNDVATMRGLTTQTTMFGR